MGLSRGPFGNLTYELTCPWKGRFRGQTAPNKAYFPFLFLSLVCPTGSRQPGPGQGREGLHQSARGLASQSLVQRPAASHREPVRNADSGGPDTWVRTCISAGSLADACAQGGSRAADAESSIGWESWRDGVPVVCLGQGVTGGWGRGACRCYLPDWCRLAPAETETACGSGLHPPFQWGFFIKWALQALVQDD